MKKEEQLTKKIDEDAANVHAVDDDYVHWLWTSIVSLSTSVHSYLSQPAFYTRAYTQAGTAVKIE